jgi:hypothetical protein
MRNSNYSNKGESPFRKGRLGDVVKPKKPLVHRTSYKSDKAIVDALTIDLVQEFANIGIIIQNVHTIAKGLVKCGWVKLKKLKSEG